MSSLDIAKLKQQQEELEKRSSGSKNWIQLSKIEDPIDVRILDPLPSMDGVYYVEVPMWWINGTRVISPKLFGPDEKDVVEEVIEEAKKSKDPTLKKLLTATGDNGMAKIQKKVEFWVPVLKLNFEIKNDKLQGVYDAKGEFDTELIRKFVEDDRCKILVSGIQLLKSINTIATSRGGSQMTDPVNGFNLTIGKTGEKRKTKYTALPADKIPMPSDFYSEEKMADPFEIAQSLMLTDEYAELIILNYLYGDALPEVTDDDYEYPEIRAKLKNKFSEQEESSDPKTSKRVRPSLREQRIEKELPMTPSKEDLARIAKKDEKKEPDKPVIDPHDDLAQYPAGVRRGRPARIVGGTRTAPGKRNLVDDLADA